MKAKRKIILTIFLTICALTQLFSQSINHGGKILESISFPSKVLNRDVKYSAYLPYDYEYSSTRLYPVVYLLHGLTGNEMDWIERANIKFIADDLIGKGEIPPMIIIMPDAKNTFYVNDFKNEDRYMDMFFAELMPYMERTYRTRNDEYDRAIAGLSMGGYGALVYAMKHPELFSTCIALSAAVKTDEDIINIDEEMWKNYSGLRYGGLNGKSRLTPTWRNNDPITMVDTRPLDSLKMVHYYIDCGDDDHLIGGNCALHLAMKKKGIPHEFRVRDGVHDWMYWKTGIVDGLKLIGFYFTGGY